MSKSKRSSKKRAVSRNRRDCHNEMKMKQCGFVECSVAGLLHFTTETAKNGLYMFDSIDFCVTDTNHKCFEVEGLRFEADNGWYDPNVDIPKYYGMDVYKACMDYAVDRGIRDGLYLGLALLGQKRPAGYVLRLSHSEIVRMIKERLDAPIVLIDEKGNKKIA